MIIESMIDKLERRRGEAGEKGVAERRRRGVAQWKRGMQGRGGAGVRAWTEKGETKLERVRAWTEAAVRWRQN